MSRVSSLSSLVMDFSMGGGVTMVAKMGVVLAECVKLLVLKTRTRMRYCGWWPLRTHTMASRSIHPHSPQRGCTFNQASVIRYFPLSTRMLPSRTSTSCTHMLVMAQFLTIPLQHRKEKQCHNF